MFFRVLGYLFSTGLVLSLSTSSALADAPDFQILLGPVVTVDSLNLALTPLGPEEAALFGVLSRWSFQTKAIRPENLTKARQAHRPYVEHLLLLLEQRHTDQPGAARRANLRNYYAHKPADILGLTEPIDIGKASVYWDGGSLLLELVDARGQTVQILVPARVKQYE